jgi:hypothetical protein
MKWDIGMGYVREIDLYALTFHYGVVVKVVEAFIRKVDRNSRLVLLRHR